jgi:hypothetical protein
MLKLFGFEDPVTIAQLIAAWGAWVIIMAFGIFANDWIAPAWALISLTVFILAFTVWTVKREKKHFRDNRKSSPEIK